MGNRSPTATKEQSEMGGCPADSVITTAPVHTLLFRPAVDAENKATKAHSLKQRGKHSIRAVQADMTGTPCNSTQHSS
jgi:hypothetical protein